MKRILSLNQLSERTNRVHNFWSVPAVESQKSAEDRQKKEKLNDSCGFIVLQTPSVKVHKKGKKKKEADIQSSRSNPHIHSQSHICFFSRRKRAWKMNIYGVIQGNGDIHRIIQTRVDSILLRAKRKKRSCQLPTFRFNRETTQVNRYYFFKSLCNIQQCISRRQDQDKFYRAIFETKQNEKKKCELVNERCNDKKVHLIVQFMVPCGYQEMV